jgi:hypothetical protein
MEKNSAGSEALAMKAVQSWSSGVNRERMAYGVSSSI